MRNLLRRLGIKAGDSTLDLTTPTLSIDGTEVTSTAAELNILDGVTSTAAELNILDGVTATAAELNALDGITSTVAELNILDTVTSTAAELNILDGVTSTAAELNILDGVTATAAEINALDDAPVTITIGLAASATTDGMDVTVTVKDGAGAAIDAVHMLEWWISEAATGIGLTGDSYSGDVTTVTGTEYQQITDKKHYTSLTDANGVLGILAVDSANPADQYIAVKHPSTGLVIVSAVSGTNWEGAA